MENPTPVKIPKLDPSRNYLLEINKSHGIICDGRGNTMVTLKKNVVEGIPIPKGTTILVINDVVTRESTHVRVSGEELNKVIRSLFFDSLRTRKRT